MQASMTINDKEFTRLFAKIEERMQAKDAMEIVGEIGLTSIQRNFEEGGRPGNWRPLAASTIKQRIRERKWPGQILMKTGVSGGLLGSISYEAKSRQVIWYSNKIYAAIHHFGGQAGKNHAATIPARPYMMLQDEDWPEIKAALTDFYLGGA